MASTLILYLFARLGKYDYFQFAAQITLWNAFDDVTAYLICRACGVLMPHSQHKLTYSLWYRRDNYKIHTGHPKKHLKHKQRNLKAVGQPSQCIYAWGNLFTTDSVSNDDTILHSDTKQNQNIHTLSQTL